MDDAAKILITLGGLLLVGLVVEATGRKTRLPRVTLLLIFGFFIGPTVFNLIPDVVTQRFPLVTNMALAMIGFLLGGKMTPTFLRRHGRSVFLISIAVVVTTTFVVFLGLTLIGVIPLVALLLAGCAAATDPLATTAVVNETRSHGKFVQTLLGVVAIDDVWTLVMFSLILAVAQAYYGDITASAWWSILTGSWDILGAVVLGVVLGVPMSYITGRIKPGEPTLIEALGVVFLAAGIAVWIHVSFLLALMVLGCVVANLAKHHKRPFHEIENIEWLFLIFFFILAGASLHPSMMYHAGFAGVLYIILRIAGRVLGGWFGATMSGEPLMIKRWIGLALMPQAGVAIAMGLIATQIFADFGQIILPVVLGSSVLFEMLGPILTARALTAQVQTNVGDS